MEERNDLAVFTFSIDAGSRATSPSFAFDIAKYESGDVLFRLKWPSMKERSIFLLYSFKIAQMFLWRCIIIFFFFTITIFYNNLIIIYYYNLYIFLIRRMLTDIIARLDFIFVIHTYSVNIWHLCVLDKIEASGRSAYSWHRVNGMTVHLRRYLRRRFAANVSIEAGRVVARSVYDENKNSAKDWGIARPDATSTKSENA